MQVKKSHFYSRFLARNWEATPGHLRLYRFDTGRIHRGSAKSSFTSDTPFSAEVEALLGSVVETPLGAYIARCRTASGHIVRDAAMSEDEDRALVLALFTQPERTAHAQGTADVAWLVDLLGQPEKMRQFVAGARQIGEIAGANLSHDDLFLPSTGVVALPLAGLHGWMLPLTPTAFAAFIPRQASIAGLQRLLASPGLLRLLSVGIHGDVVAVPPSWSATDTEIAKWVVAARAFARTFNQTVWNANGWTDMPPLPPLPGHE